MEVAWKFIAVLALLFSLAAITLEIVRIQGRDETAAIQREIAETMQAREQSLIARLESRVNALRQDRDLPVMQINSLEDLGEAITEVIGATPHAQVQPAARP